MKFLITLRRRLRAADRTKAPRSIPCASLFVALYCGSYLLWTLFGRATAETHSNVSDFIVPATSLIGNIWAWWGFRKRPPAEKGDGEARPGALAALLLSLGLASYLAGSLIWSYHSLILHERPSPSWADPFYLLAALFSVAGLMFFPSRPLSAMMRVRVFLDSLMVMAALFTFSWFFTLGPTVLDSRSTPLGKVLGATYPMIDLLMMFCVLAVSAQSDDVELRRIRNLACSAVSCIVVSDVAYLYLTMHQRVAGWNPFDVGLLLANLLCGQAIMALRLYRRKTPAVVRNSVHEVPQSPSLWRSLLPYALVPAVAGLLGHVWHIPAQGALAKGVYVGAASLIGLILVRQVFAIIENARLFRRLQAAYVELESLATTDGMTGLANHRTFHERLRDNIDDAVRSGLPVSLLLLDVDRFKEYNDRFGHPAGDEALRIVARLLRENMRATDLPARYGGEEFAVVMPGTAMREAAGIAERIRAAVEAETFPHREVTLSIGVASTTDGEAGALIEAADRSLYVAKRGGRNCVVESASDTPLAEAA